MKARKVTRTIKVTDVTALVVLDGHDELTEEQFTISGHFKTDEDILKALKKGTSGFTFVRVISSTPITNLYSMDETEFMSLAKIVDKR